MASRGLLRCIRVWACQPRPAGFVQTMLGHEVRMRVMPHAAGVALLWAFRRVAFLLVAPSANCAFFLARPRHVVVITFSEELQRKREISGPSFPFLCLLFSSFSFPPLPVRFSPFLPVPSRSFPFFCLREFRRRRRIAPSSSASTRVSPSSSRRGQVGRGMVPTCRGALLRASEHAS